MSDRDELISQFCSIAGCEAERAEFFLGSGNWQLETALNSFYAEPDMAEEVEEMPPAVPVAPSPTATGNSAPSRPAVPTSRFGTLASLGRDDESDEEEDGPGYYAGGSEQSGQIIRGPRDPKKDRIGVQDVFDSAKKHGAEVVGDPGQQAGKKKDQTFAGSGFRLGNEPSASASASVPAINNQQEEPEDTERTITFWKNGFSVDDGPIRKIDDPTNKEFLGSVMRGEIPRELQRGAAEVHVNMVDKRGEDFVPPKPVLRPFSGSGHRLGSPAPQVAAPSVAPTNPPTASKPSVNLDESQPTTSIQIRLADGTRLVSKFNHTHTVGDIRGFINLSRPDGPASYSLMTTFPNKVLAEESQSISQAGLLNAVIVQKRS